MRKRLFYNITIDIFTSPFNLLATEFILLVSRWTEFALRKFRALGKKNRELYTAHAKKVDISDVFANKFYFVSIICYLQLTSRSFF